MAALDAITCHAMMRTGNGAQPLQYQAISLDSFTELQALVGDKAVFKLFFNPVMYKEEAANIVRVLDIVVTEEAADGNTSVPHILKAVRVNDVDGWLYGLQVMPGILCCVYERLDMTLSQYMRTEAGQALWDADVLDVAVKPQLDKFLGALHKHGLYHRDVKADNVMVRATVPPQFFMCDYGGIGSAVEMVSTFPSPYVVNALRGKMHKYVAGLAPGAPTPACFDAYYSRMGMQRLNWNALVPNRDSDYSRTEMMRHNDSFGFWVSVLYFASRLEKEAGRDRAKLETAAKLHTSALHMLREPIVKPHAAAAVQRNPLAVQWEESLSQEPSMTSLRACERRVVADVCSAVEDLDARATLANVLELRLLGKSNTTRAIHVKPVMQCDRAIVLQAMDESNKQLTQQLYDALSDTSSSTWTIVGIDSSVPSLDQSVMVRLLLQDDNAFGGGSGGKARKQIKRHRLGKSGREYVVRTGSRGGKYVVVKGKRVYVRV